MSWKRKILIFLIVLVCLWVYYRREKIKKELELEKISLSSKIIEVIIRLIFSLENKKELWKETALVFIEPMVIVAKLLFKDIKKLINYLYKKCMNENKLCSLCKFQFSKDKPREAIHQLKDKEFGEFQPTCDYHCKFQLGLVWEAKEKARNYRKAMTAKTESEIGKSLMIGAERTVLNEEVSMWERMKGKNFGFPKKIINYYIRKLYKEKNELKSVVNSFHN